MPKPRKWRLSKIRLGISSCLLGVECNFSGSHNRCDFATKSLNPYVEYIASCPEDIMLGHPRESIRIVKTDGGLAAIGNKTKQDYTKELTRICEEEAERVLAYKPSGYILKGKSPTCGMERIKIYAQNGIPVFETAEGFFAAALAQKAPYLPMEEDGRLQDAWLRENFVMHIFAYDDFFAFKEQAATFGALVDFHTKYKYLLLAKDEPLYRELGRVVANNQKLPFSEVLAAYEPLFLQAIAKKNRVNPIINVLMHMLGFLKEHLEPQEKQEILASFEEFKAKVVPLIVPIKLLNLYINRYEINYLQNQVFLNPYPAELALRSDIKAFK